MVETYHMFVKDKHVGDLTHDTSGDKYIYKQILFNDEDADFFNYKTNALESPERFRETLYDDRIFPPDRIDARQILQALGLFEYNPWEIFKLTQMISGDTIWMSKDLNGEWFWYNHPFASNFEEYTKRTGKPMYSIVGDVDQSSIYT